MRRYVPTPPSHKYKSPVFTHKFKFNGKARVLNQESAANSSGNYLKSNPYARILSSPSRIDRGSRYIALPRDLLLRFSVIKNKKDDSLWFVPNVHNFISGNNSSYSANGVGLLKQINAKSWPKIASLEILNNNTNITKTKDINWNDSNWVLINQFYIEILIEELKEVQQKHKVEENDLKILWGSDEAAYSFNGSNTVINLSKYEIKATNYKEFLSILEEKNGKSIIIGSENEKFIDTFIKFISYNSKL